jgi:hypothetical protein
MWWLGQSPSHHVCGSLLGASCFFITLLGGIPLGRLEPIQRGALALEGTDPL